MNERAKTNPELDKALQVILALPTAPESDYRVPIDMTIQSIGYALDELQSYLDQNGREAEYLGQCFDRLWSEQNRLVLICSLIKERRRQLTEAAE